MARSFVSLGGLAVAALICVACGGEKPGGVCGDITLPGVRVSLPGIQLSIRNQFGQAEAVGARVTVSGAAGTQSEAIDSLTLYLYGVPAGTHSVEISKPFYRDTTISNLVVQQGTCGDVNTTMASAVLQLVQGAPSIRSLVIFGAMFLAAPGTQSHLVADVDADPGVSRSVTWRLSDTTLARIDQTGLVTSKCSTRGGVDTVTATSVANPVVNGQTAFGIGVQASCP